MVASIFSLMACGSAEEGKVAEPAVVTEEVAEEVAEEVVEEQAAPETTGASTWADGQDPWAE